jgi:hypothetical protein
VKLRYFAGLSNANGRGFVVIEGLQQPSRPLSGLLLIGFSFLFGTPLLCPKALTGPTERGQRESRNRGSGLAARS